MSIFRRDPSTSDDAPLPTPRSAGSAPDASRRVTYVAPGSKLVGLIMGKTEVLVDGDLEGEIKLDGRVVIGPEGRVKGNVVARSVRIAGKMYGNVRGLERVELMSTASLEGNLAAPRLVIADGAFFKGEVEMAAAKRARGEEGGEALPPAARQAASPVSTRSADEARNPKGS